MIRSLILIVIPSYLHIKQVSTSNYNIKKGYGKIDLVLLSIHWSLRAYPSPLSLSVHKILFRVNYNLPSTVGGSKHFTVLTLQLSG